MFYMFFMVSHGWWFLFEKTTNIVNVFKFHRPMCCYDWGPTSFQPLVGYQQGIQPTYFILTWNGSQHGPKHRWYIASYDRKSPNEKESMMVILDDHYNDSPNLIEKFDGHIRWPSVYPFYLYFQFAGYTTLIVFHCLLSYSSCSKWWYRPVRPAKFKLNYIECHKCFVMFVFVLFVISFYIFKASNTAGILSDDTARSARRSVNQVN